VALQAGKNIRWVAEELGHADPALRIRAYARAMREDEATSRSPASLARGHDPRFRKPLD
jgi:hypothetical protein